MAGKETPRQKMINMMYLIFIAMLALNLSKQILQSFGVMNAELTDTNKELEVRNDQFMQGLEEKAQEQADKYLDLKLKADSIRTISTTFYDFLEATKEAAYLKAEEKGTKRTEYGKMDLTSHFTEIYFDGEEYKEGGKEFIQEMDNFRDLFVKIASSDEKLKSIAEEVADKFSTDDIIDSDGKSRKYLDYHYKEMPLIVGITKLSLLQSTLQNIEAQLLSTMLEGKLKIEASLTNFDAIVVPDKASYLPNENFTGKIILGKKDKTLKADKVTVNGNVLDEEYMQEGVTILNFPAGPVGTRTIEGQFEFMEEGDPVVIEIKNEDGEPFTYEVVAPPNSASVSADKMNVVYEGVRNPFTISIPGISPNRTRVSAPGIKKGKSIMNQFGVSETINGPSDYELDLRDADLGNDATKLVVSVSGETTDGAQVGPFKTEFRVKQLPTPDAAFNNAYGDLGQTKMDLIQGQLNAQFSDFDFNLPVIVTSFDIQVRGQLISNQGSELSAQAKGAVGAAPSGSVLSVENIKTAAIGSNVQVKDAKSFAIIIN